MKFRYFHCRNRDAFTLIELMISVSIVGMLAVIAIPSFTKYREQARLAESYIGLKAMSDGQRSYYAANNRFISQGVQMISLFAIGSAQLGQNLPTFNSFRAERSDGTDEWKETSPPFAHGAQVNFLYMVDAGNTDAAGNWLAGGIDTGHSLFKTNSGGAVCWTTANTTGVGTGTNITAQTLGAPAAPGGNYSFAFLLAFGVKERLLNMDNMIDGGQFGNCYYIFEMLQVGNGSFDVESTGVITLKP